jgi:hypothetical protein
MLKSIVVFSPSVTLEAETSQCGLLVHLLTALGAIRPLVPKFLQNLCNTPAGVTLKYIKGHNGGLREKISMYDVRKATIFDTPHR